MLQVAPDVTLDMIVRYVKSMVRSFGMCVDFSLPDPNLLPSRAPLFLPSHPSSFLLHPLPSIPPMLSTHLLSRSLVLCPFSMAHSPKLRPASLPCDSSLPLALFSHLTPLPGNSHVEQPLQALGAAPTGPQLGAAPTGP